VDAARIFRADMDELGFTVRRLTSDDAEAFRSIRLEALKEYPEAYGSTFEREASEPITYFTERLESSHIFGVFRQESLVGVAGFRAMDGPKDRHKGFIWGMYVQRSLQGSGAAELLLENLIVHARSRVELVQLTVTANNLRGFRFYQKMGFSVFGIEQRALKQNGVYFDEIWMVRFLKEDSDFLTANRLPSDQEPK
jgi:ribosomal protein S18 acetylase RimI-like enzyme